MFQLRLAAAGVVLGVPNSREATRSTEGNQRLNAQLVLERAQPSCSVQGPVASGRASKSIPEEHADLRGNAARGGKHGDPATFQVRLASASEVLEVSISREASRITEAN